jgi:hypothetical protein
MMLILCSMSTIQAGYLTGSIQQGEYNTFIKSGVVLSLPTELIGFNQAYLKQLMLLIF